MIPTEIPNFTFPVLIQFSRDSISDGGGVVCFYIKSSIIFLFETI